MEHERILAMMSECIAMQAREQPGALLEQLVALSSDLCLHGFVATPDRAEPCETLGPGGYGGGDRPSLVRDRLVQSVGGRAIQVAVGVVGEVAKLPLDGLEPVGAGRVGPEV